MGSREGLWAFLHCTAKAAQRESQLPLLCKESDREHSSPVTTGAEPPLVHRMDALSGTRCLTLGFQAQQTPLLLRRPGP